MSLFYFLCFLILVSKLLLCSCSFFFSLFDVSFFIFIEDKMLIKLLKM
nr:MAG TPA: hypothetical protein [Caudoviricetes sp.]